MTTLPYTVLVDQRDERAWLEARMHGVGASEVAALLDKDPYKDAGTLLAEKLGWQEPENLDGNGYVYWGKWLEDSILEGYRQLPSKLMHYEYKGGQQVQRWTDYGFCLNRRAERWGKLLQSTRVPQLLSTPDAWQADPRRQGNGVLQIKLKGATKTTPAPHHIIQVQAELAVTGLQWGSLVMLCGGQRLVVHDIERDEALIEDIFQAVAEFWHEVERREGKAA